MPAQTLFIHLSDADEPALTHVLPRGRVCVSFDAGTTMSPEIIGSPDQLRRLGLALLDAVVAAKTTPTAEEQDPATPVDDIVENIVIDINDAVEDHGTIVVYADPHFPGLACRTVDGLVSGSIGPDMGDGYDVRNLLHAVADHLGTTVTPDGTVVVTAKTMPTAEEQV